MYARPTNKKELNKYRQDEILPTTNKFFKSIEEIMSFEILFLFFKLQILIDSEYFSCA